jgi:hypothetical protein
MCALLRQNPRLACGHSVILDHKTLEKSFGWVFFYAPQAYLTSNNPADLVPGTAPIIVNLKGKVTQLNSSINPTKAIADYERDWKGIQ